MGSFHDLRAHHLPGMLMYGYGEMIGCEAGAEPGEG